MLLLSATNHHAIPHEPHFGGALVLAIVMHGLLLLFLWIGISWHHEKPVLVEAEIWDVPVKQAASKSSSSVMVPMTLPVSPVHISPPPQPSPILSVNSPSNAVSPDIILKKEKTHKETVLHQRKQEDTEKEAQAHKIAKEKAALEIKKREEEKIANEKRQAKEKLAAEKRRKAAEEKREAQIQAEKRQVEMRRQAELDRMLRGAIQSDHISNTASNTQTKEDALWQKPYSNPGYAQRVAALIRAHTDFPVPEGLSGNPAVQYNVTLRPDGSVNQISKLKSSNIAGFDEAVYRAIQNTIFPKDEKTSRVPSHVKVIHHPKD